MHVILKEDFPSLGYVGDKVAVRRGYARNFLIPRGIAVEASDHNVKLLNHRLSGIMARRARLKSSADELAKALAQVTLEYTLKIGEKGKSFGSVTPKEIVESLKAQGYTLDRKQIKLTEPIKRAGEHTVRVVLHSEVTALIPVKVISESQRFTAMASQEKPKRNARAKRGSGKTKETAAQQAPATEQESVEKEG